MKNNSSTPYSILPTDQIAQFILKMAALLCIEVAEYLPLTTRDKGAFGSTETQTRRIRHQSFRLDNQCVLTMNNSNPFRPVARKIKALLKLPSPSSTPTSQAYNLIIILITTHNVNTESHEIHPVHNQTTPPIPTIPPPESPSQKPFQLQQVQMLLFLHFIRN